MLCLLIKVLSAVNTASSFVTLHLLSQVSISHFFYHITYKIETNLYFLLQNVAKEGKTWMKQIER
ncbi:hypothetical protein DRO45_02015 [Candidatus Bathyarchaeota archaeon]|nr:MAG: hypothetical protein DRO25_01670 [Candidatus Bathyarchaeota archaeon]RLI21675.1 MAG: hypothetical protein DRO45_02015 [Candidatus Bathyarchaeota archaeon]